MSYAAVQAVQRKRSNRDLRPARAIERRQLKVPPGWTDVRVSDDASSPVIASGRDSKGRIQYLYSGAYLQAAHERKFRRVRQVARRFAEIERQLYAGLRRGEDEAVVLLIIAQTGMRVGGERDRRGKQRVYGAATLLAEHVQIRGETVRFDFVGKQGIRNQQVLRDRRIANAVAGRLDGLGAHERLFLTSDDDVRVYLHETVGGLLVKDLRTHRANVLAAAEVAAMPSPATQAEFRRLRRQVAGAVSAQLGNTPAVCLSSYIDPRQFARWQKKLG